MKSKKIIATLVATIMSLTVATTVLAEEFKIDSQQTYIYLDDGTGIVHDDYIEANSKLVQLGKVAILRRSNITLDVPYYAQAGEPWSNDIMQTAGDTIGDSGCALTSFAMIQRYLGGNDDPGEVNTTLGNDACPFMYWGAAETYNYTISASYHSNAGCSENYAEEFIIGAIDTGYPVLVGIQKYSGGQHFVTAYGYDSGTVYIHDPGSANYGDETLSELLENGNITRLYVFEN